MVRAPAAPSESLKPESSPEEPPEPVDLEPEEDVVMEPLAVGPAGVVPLLWGKGAIAAGVASGAVAMSWPAASEEAAATAVSAAVSARALDGSDEEVGSSVDVQLEALVALLTDALTEPEHALA